MSFMRSLRRTLLSGLACLALATSLPQALAAREVTDVTGRTVTVPDHVGRILLGEGRIAYALALLDQEHPFSRIVGWQNDLRRMDPHTYAAYAARYPEVEQIATIGQSSADTMSAEAVLALRPDIAIFSVVGDGAAQAAPMVDKLAAAGIPSIFVDFRGQPLKNTLPSVRLLGEVLERPAQAAAFEAFYTTHFHRIRDRLAAHSGPRPSVFLELLAGVWRAPGHTTGVQGLGELIAAAGGRNIAADRVPGSIGDVNMEFVLQQDPQIYIATGNRAPGVELGAEADAAQAAASLRRVLSRPEVASLTAVQKGRAYGLWHDYYNSPYNIVALEALAKWIHPELFQDVDLHATQRELYDRFLGIGADGAYWVDAPAAP